MIATGDFAISGTDTVQTAFNIGNASVEVNRTVGINAIACAGISSQSAAGDGHIAGAAIDGTGRCGNGCIATTDVNTGFCPDRRIITGGADHLQGTTLDQHGGLSIDHITAVADSFHITGIQRHAAGGIDGAGFIRIGREFSAIHAINVHIAIGINGIVVGIRSDVVIAVQINGQVAIGADAANSRNANLEIMQRQRTGRAKPGIAATGWPAGNDRTVFRQVLSGTQGNACDRYRSGIGSLGRLLQCRDQQTNQSQRKQNAK